MCTCRNINTHHIFNSFGYSAIDKSETTHGLKRYTILTLSDRCDYNPNTRNKVISK
jgi:hypothetical protein